MNDAICIDLGTTYSAVAVIDEVGIPKLIENQSKTRRDNLICSTNLKTSFDNGILV